MSEDISAQAGLVQLRERLHLLQANQAEELGRMRAEMAGLLGRIEWIEKRVPPPFPAEAPVRAVPPETVADHGRSPVPSASTAGVGPEPKPVAAAPKPVAATVPEDEVPDRQGSPKREEVTKARGSFELNFGRVWLVRLGIALLVTGLVLLGNYAYRNWIRDLPAMVRLGFLLVGAFGISATGWWFTLKEGMKRFGEVVLAGGMAFFYWCVYASHHVDRLQVVGSPVMGAVLLLGAAAAIVWVSIQRDARSTAMMGLLLASYSTVLQPLGWMSGVSNVALAAAGVLLMQRRGWAGPGVASMAGTYLAFLWWQLGGASGGVADRVGLFFLPASWAVFSQPGLAGMAKGLSSSLSARGRAWFIGANNGAFFGLFSLLWFHLGYENYWTVPAVFGGVLLALAFLARRRESVMSVHLGQGLAALSMAMVIRLDGYHLALGLGVESLLLAGAFLRFGRALELWFCLLAMIGAVAVSMNDPWVPVWSAGLLAVVLASAGVVTKMGGQRIKPEHDLSTHSKVATVTGIGGATLVGLILWCACLPSAVQSITAGLTAIGLLAGSMALRRRLALPELWAASLAFGIWGMVMVLESGHRMGPDILALVALLAVLGVWLWEGSGRLSSRGGVVVPSEEPMRIIGAWQQALVVPAALGMALGQMSFSKVQLLVIDVTMVPLLAVVAGRFVGSARLRAALSLMLLVAVVRLSMLSDPNIFLCFSVTASSLITLFFSRECAVKSQAADRLLMVVTRFAALAGWMLGWWKLLPDQWMEVMALSGAALFILRPKRVSGMKLPEALVLFGAGLLSFGESLISEPWERLSETAMPAGWGVVAALGVAAFLRGSKSKFGRDGLYWSAALALALWATRALVWNYGWQPSVVLWTALGFGLVSLGLWQRVAVLRHAGFALFGLAIGKLFVLDIWDFGAFTRVAAFLALGVALVVLGFFYNRFAGLLKRLFEADA